MSDAIVSRLGQDKAAGDALALFYKIFTGEVLTAYEVAKKLKPLVRVRQISSGKSAGFNALFTTKARYHKPGTEIKGQKIQATEITVTLDDLLISDTFVAQIDELMNHYDVRAPYSAEAGRSLALLEDRAIAQCLIKAARGAALFTGDQGGGSVTEANVGASADFAASGADIISALSLAKQRLDEKDVPVDILPVNGLLKPAQWYLAANSDKNINKDFGGQGSVMHQRFDTSSDVRVFKSNAPLFGRDVTPYNAASNTDGVVPAVEDGPVAADYEKNDIPFDFPTKYQLDATNTRGVVWVEPAVAYLQLLGLTSESGWDMRRQGTLMLHKMAIGMDALRSKAAIEIKTA
jgi:hypothetical protein